MSKRALGMRAEEPEKKPGRLRIYFSYTAGTGKSFAMLEAAHEEKSRGTGVVAGYLSPLSASQTVSLLDGLEALPLYKSGEFHLDRAIRRHPQLILVDEMEHTNAQGCRNRKRYQDIEELLKAGIDVYTTLGVQNIESLSDAVTSIIGNEETNRIPDSIFDSADQVDLIDIEPEELIVRMRKSPDERLLEKLSALRELALRRCADRMGKKAEKSQQSGFHEETHLEEHILTCISGSPSNAKVIRAAARIANAFHGSFTALFVQQADDTKEKGSDVRLMENLKLAEQLGARVATVYGRDIATQIAEYAKISGVTKIVIGRSNGKRRWFANKPVLVERLIGIMPNMDIYIIPESMPPFEARHSEKVRWSFADACKTAGILCLTSLVGLWFYHLGFSEANITTVYILGVLLISIATNGQVYGSIASLLSVVVFNYLFTEPRFSLVAYNTGHLITFTVMLIASFVASSLTIRVKDQAVQAARKAYRTEVLLETSQMLQRTKSSEEIIGQTARQMIKLLGRSVFFYPVGDGRLKVPVLFEKDGEAIVWGRYTSESERKVAQWVLSNGKHAGATTNTHSDAKCLYLAVRSQINVFAVTGIVMEGVPILDAFEKNLLIAMLSECALALEKEQMSDTKNRIAIQAQREQLRANLLRAISHDLRTPLTSISGSAGILMSNNAILSESKKQQLYTDIYDDSIWLINLVENLLSVTRIENGTMNLHMEPELLDEVIQEALAHINRRSSEHPIQVQLEDDLLMARMDSRLIIQVVINIIDNAIKYTKLGSTIRISAKKEHQMVVVEIADDGDGIPDDQKKHLFEMFFTADNQRSDRRRGLGLGLFLCKSIINAHGGTISVQDNQPHGTIFCFTLPAEEVPYHE